jgi:NAD(P)-dependent dehydrogenase (short-subunit alcohol dehydrogenase family)
LHSKVILITGASSGIGLASANLLAQRGHTVFGTSRTPERRQIEGFELLQLDVRSDESVSACIQTVIERTGRIDVLVNNAGHGMVGFLEEVTLDDAKAIFETNFFGVLRMVNTVLPIMRTQGSGHIINVSSLAGLIGLPSEGMYAATKFALEGYTETLWYELKRLSIRVSLLEPGDYNTPIVMQSASQTIEDYRTLQPRVIPTRAALLRNAPDPTPVARMLAHMVESKSPRLRYQVGREKWDVMWKRFLPEWVFEWFARRTFKLDED